MSTWVIGCTIEMKQAFLCCLVIVVCILAVRSEGIHTSTSGSKKCPDLSLQSLPANSARYQRLLILNGRKGDPHDSLKDCRVISVRYTAILNKKRFSIRGTRWFTKQADNNNVLQLKTRENIPKNVKVTVELNCKDKKCSLSSFVNSAAVSNGRLYYQRKLLGVKSSDDDKQSSFYMMSAWMTVSAILTLIVVLAMCACNKNNVERTISDEVGGTSYDEHVVGLSTVDKTQQNAERRDTSNSKRSENISTGENGGVRTASQSSQQNDKTPHLESIGNQSYTKVNLKVEEISLTAANPEATRDKDRVRSHSTKEQTSQNNEPVDTAGFSQSDTFMYKGNIANIATPTQGRKQPVQLITRKGSDKKESKEQDGNVKSKKSWLRRKSSKTKSTSENQSSKDDKKVAGKTSRHSTVPLPPTPDGKTAPPFIEEENQYEAVETRPRKALSETATKKPKITQVPRPSSELYACIDDDNEMKRNSTGNHMYDVVETKGKPPKTNKDNASGLEYAYTVVAPKDDPIKPSQTSSGSDLYEVVSDDMKRIIPLIQEFDDNYAVVEKKHSIPTKSPPTRPLSDTGIVVPTPPSVIHMPSVARRAQSEGDNLHKPAILGANVKAEHTYAKVNKQRKTVRDTDKAGDTICADGLGDESKELSSSDTAEHMYAAVNKQRKTSHTDKAENNRTPDNFCMDGLGDESDEPPPIPHCLYSELPYNDESDEPPQIPPSLYSELPLKDESDEPPQIPPSLYSELPLKDEGDDGMVTSNTVNVNTMVTTINTDSLTASTDNRKDNNSSIIMQSETSSRISGIRIEGMSTASTSNVQVLTNRGVVTTQESVSEETVIISVDGSKPQSNNSLYDIIYYV